MHDRDYLTDNAFDNWDFLRAAVFLFKRLRLTALSIFLCATLSLVSASALFAEERVSL